MSTRTFLYALLLIFGLWLMGTLVLAAEAALQRPHAPAAPHPVTTPHANTNAVPVNCHHSNPPTTSPYLAVARADATRAGIDVLTFAWQIWQESGYQPEVVSPAGALGIAQFLPATAAGMGIDPRDPRAALAAAARLDASHLRQYASPAQALAAHYGGNATRYAYGLALAAYNAGPGAASWAWQQAYAGGTRWPKSGPWAWLKLLALETQRYIPAILGCAL